MARVDRHNVARTARLAGACATVALAGCGGVSPAPAASTLPLAPQARLIASAAGGSQVDPAHDRNRYRYMALTGAPHMSGAALISAEIRSLLMRGWGDERSIGFRGTATVAQPVPVTTAGAEVLLDSPDRREYAAVSVLINGTAASVQTSRTALSDDATIATALADRRPVLWIVLGNGSHS